ncbi:hypothetical protein F2Q70_00042816 [Brassica cretica]|uniref:Secreted protein n=1 Tax=Brassica cretica TaxID=69181 RepID=A0A8S9KP19_BRACR|nr:hypothetical protein F2Q70_00042816 [Brassica cretica]KAF3519645.1 hypothetical protein DY000_02059377 [Brassica cretica]
MIQSAIPLLLLDFSLMMTLSVSLSVAMPQGREISSKTPNLFVDLSSTMNHWTCRSVPLLENSASLSRWFDRLRHMKLPQTRELQSQHRLALVNGC